jgi:hypothetical protein
MTQTELQAAVRAKRGAVDPLCVLLEHELPDHQKS